MNNERKFKLLLSKRLEAVIEQEIDDVFKILSKVIANKVTEDLRGYYLYMNKKDKE